MATLERHVSPDGVLTLRVDLKDGDWTIGFEDTPAHTHADLLSSWYGYPDEPELAVRQFVDDVLESRRGLIIWWVGSTVRDVDWPNEVETEELNASLAKYGAPAEWWQVRYWDGKVLAESSPKISGP